MRKLTVLFATAAIAANAGAASLAVTDARQQVLPDGASRIIRGSVLLPTDGLWNFSESQAKSAPLHLHALPPASVMEGLTGHRMRDVERERNIQRGQSPLRMLQYLCMEYAQTNANRGPSTLSALDTNPDRGIAENIGQSPWPETHPDLKGPFVFLVPNATFRFEPNNRRVTEANRDVLAFELQPFVDDGKHWVLYTDGTCRREVIDPQLIARYDQQIRPVNPADEPQMAPSDQAAYTLVAVANPETPATFDAQLINSLTGAKTNVTWSWKDAPADDSLTGDLKRARVMVLAPYARVAPTPALHTWMSDNRDANFSTANREPSAASVFGLFGGRPAVEETLQMQLLRGVDDRGARTLDVSSIEGVSVESHPFAEMLGNQKVTPSTILDLVPADHLAVHVVKPSALLPFLNDGADFVSSLGGTVTGKGVRYYLKDRYLAQLGFGEEWIQRLLKTGIVKEMALYVPDLFFIDGTDVTVITRVSQPSVLAGLLKLIGVSGLDGGKVVAVKTDDGQQAFWALKGEYLLVSTSRPEIDLALALAGDPAGSLGRSAEFRYMLTRLPVRGETRMMTYFSDPFIRRLVGPGVKIGQLRRALARMRMEHLTSLALLATADGVQRPLTVKALQQRGYLPGDMDLAGLSLAADGRAVSDAYGTLARPASLSAAPVTTVTAKEAEAYRSYMENYNRFWRQFFDPIAVRIDDAPDGGMEMTTFILPLVDNSLYNGIKEVLVSGSGTPLNVPRFSPEPVLVLSLNLGEPSWTKVTEGMAELFERYVHLSPAIMDDFGPAIHMAVFDADPVIALGSGDILGAFGGNMAQFRNAEMVGIPLALSMLTRPCALAIETRDPERSIRFLRQAAAASGGRGERREREMAVEFYQVQDRNEWVYSLDIVGMVKLRFGIEIAGKHLIVRNIPWAQGKTLADAQPSPLNAARLAAFPAACVLQRPALYAAAMEKERQAAMQGAARLFPIAYALDLPADKALSMHAALYGFSPVHPEGGTWTGNARGISSSVFGSINRQQQPAFDAAATPQFGLMRRVERLNVSMQFEDDGLRSVLQWKTRK
jgi:hypothetical protein